MGISGCAFLPPKMALPEQINHVDELDPYLSKAIQHQTPPSISIVVTKDNNIAYSKSFGHNDAEAQIPATPESVYQWWSITKLFTAVAVLQLQEANLLHIDDSVVTHLPAFTTRGKNVDPQDITVKHLLSHSSGLGDIGMSILGWVHFDGDTHPNQTALFDKSVGKYNKLKAKPGVQGRYSNFGYLALAALIESVSGLTYEQYILKNILEPLGMQNTNFIYTTQMNAAAAQGSHPNDFISKVVPIYLDTDRAVNEKRNGILWFNNVYSDQKGASGLIGPATDLIKFMQVFLPSYQNSNKPILSADNIALMQEPVLKVHKSPAPVDDLQFGLGWFIGESNGERTLSHGGSGMAFVSMLTLYPERNLGTVVMANSTYLGRTMGFKLNQLLGQVNW